MEQIKDFDFYLKYITELNKDIDDDISSLKHKAGWAYMFNKLSFPDDISILCDMIKYYQKNKEIYIVKLTYDDSYDTIIDSIYNTEIEAKNRKIEIENKRKNIIDNAPFFSDDSSDEEDLIYYRYVNENVKYFNNLEVVIEKHKIK